MTTLSSLSLRQRLSEYEKLMRLDKPIGILLLLWPRPQLASRKALRQSAR